MHRLDNLLNMVDGIAHTGILGDALVGEVDFAIGINGDILQ